MRNHFMCGGKLDVGKHVVCSRVRMVETSGAHNQHRCVLSQRMETENASGVLFLEAKVNTVTFLTIQLVSLHESLADSFSGQAPRRQACTVVPACV